MAPNWDFSHYKETEKGNGKETLSHHSVWFNNISSEPGIKSHPTDDWSSPPLPSPLQSYTNSSQLSAPIPGWLYLLWQLFGNTHRERAFSMQLQKKLTKTTVQEALHSTWNPLYLLNVFCLCLSRLYGRHCMTRVSTAEMDWKYTTPVDRSIFSPMVSGPFRGLGMVQSSDAHWDWRLGGCSNSITC